MQWIQSESVGSLIQICIDSAQQMLRVLSLLQDQGLLGPISDQALSDTLSPNSTESFLTFDLDATFISVLAILMAAAVDSSLLADHSPWSQCAYTILEGMASNGNKIAELNLKELKLLESELDQILAQDDQLVQASNLPVGNLPPNDGPLGLAVASASSDAIPSNLGLSFSDWHYELSADQLINIADSLDMDKLGWPFGDMEG